MASILAAAMTSTRVWSQDEIAHLLEDATVFYVSRSNGFAMGRVVADEAELLTLAVAPEAQRAGLGTALLAEFETAATVRGARHAFLEVAEDNTAARALYDACGWRPTGRRPGYYRGTDALILTRSL